MDKDVVITEISKSKQEIRQEQTKLPKREITVRSMTVSGHGRSVVLR